MSDVVKYGVSLLFSLYVLGAVLMFLLTTQLPNTFNLAVIRTVCWPVSIVKREVWPRGTPLPMD